MAKKTDSVKPETKVVKATKKVDISKMTTDELSKKATEIRTDIVALKKGILNGTVQNYKMGSVKKKELARVLTALKLKSKEEK
ncbi:hypothetical protein H6794_03265 [Candidatus Nomurabacteria bacterium]|jgi:ribosomal protein L29|nr:hypothetical protein [Candidatus Saccharibacteria bacterium]MCB9839848.1 hypothetical protein [Candidatus Nomurabacteria bacterium]